MARSYYGSKAEFLADCQMLVDAARAYNTPGPGSKWGAPGLINLAQGVMNEGLKALAALEDVAYWEKRVEVGMRMRCCCCCCHSYYCRAAAPCCAAIRSV